MRSFQLALLAFLLLASQGVLGQCQLFTTANQTTITCGTCVTLSAFGNGSGDVAFEEDFTAGAPVGWQFTTSAQFNNPCSPGNGTPHLWMGPGSNNPRTMVTQPMDLSLGGNICFDLLFATQGQPSPCEGPDEPQEGVYLEYSIDNGATWVTINYFNPNGGFDPMLTNWNTWCFALPLAAATPNTMIRWHQDNVTNLEYDHWGIDNIEITLNDPNFGITWLHDGFAYGLGNGGGPNPTQVCPLETTTYVAQITDGTTTCLDSVTITVVDPVIIMTAGTDATICPGDCMTLDGDAYHQVSPASTPTYENNQFNAVLNGNASVNINVQGLNMAELTDGSITQVCINSFTFSGTSICLDFGGCPCNGGTVGFGQACDLTPGSFTVTLNAPDGCGSIVLVPAGVATGNYNNTCFIPVGGAPQGPPLPAGGPWAPFQPLTGLNGCDPNGVWTLTYSAPGLGLGIGILQGWNISFDDPEIQGPVIFEWSPTTNMTDEDTFTPTVCPPGTTTYTLTATNQQGCALESAEVTITIEPCCDLEITDVITVGPSCTADDGSITIAGLSGQITGLTYALDGGAPQADATFDGLAPGTYTIEVNDDNNCPVTTTVTLEPPAGPEITAIDLTAPGCGLDDGVITVTAVGADLQYSADGGLTFQASGQLTDLAAGNYSVVVIDDLGCITDSLVVLSTATGPDILDVTVVNTTCGEDNGSATVNAAGQAPLGYSLDGITFQADPILEDLAAGDYTLTVVDADNCTATTDVTIAPSAAPTIDDISIVDPACGVEDGAITVTATGVGLEYSIDGGLTFQAGDTFSDLGSGTYTITISDADGCTAVGNVTLSAIDGPEITDVVMATSNCGQATGSITLTAAGNGLTYSSDGGATFQAGNIFNDLAAGNYDMVVQDDIGCESNVAVVVDETAPPVINSVTGTDPVCGQNNGQIVVDATGMDINYSLDGGATTQAGNSFTGLAWGNYTVTVTSYGCPVNAVLDLLQSVGPTILSLDILPPGCPGLVNGSLTVNADGAAPLQYSIDGGGTFQAANIFTGLAAGTYEVVVLEAGGCEAELEVALVDPVPLTVALSAADPACAGVCDGTATAVADGGTVAGDYVYLWSGGVAAPNAAQAVGLCAGIFTLVVLDDNGCNVDTTFTLEDPPPFLIDLITTESESCPGFCDGSLQVTAAGAAAYQVNNGAPQGTSTFLGLCAGEVEVTATSVNGCIAVSTATVDPGSLIVASFEVDPLVASILTPTFNFTNTSEGASNYLWSFGTQGISANSASEFSYTFPEQAGDYEICLIATNDEGCEDVACTRILVELDFAVHVPNAFSPDGDGLNDEFRVVGDPSLNDNFRLEIFDRWGELLFTSLDITVGWDGRVKGNPAVQGVYVWQLAVRDPKTAEIRSWRGHVTLVR